MDMRYCVHIYWSYSSWYSLHSFCNAILPLFIYRAIHAEFFTMDNPIPSSVDAVDVKAAHDKITDIANSVFWAVFKFKKGIIKTSSTGTDFKSFTAQFADDEVAFASLRLKGQNVFVLWIGEKSQQTDKLMATAVAPFIQAIIKTFAYEYTTSKKADIDQDHMIKLLKEAKGTT
ncbi:uncharacterized protein LOC124261065 [Haliotis rubra]|uniref:uncharacterized protein LOC124261065 n=1 Tax=Haliotis rubra TaxID=36100 RepID=UPI001EE5FF98|nr:uncharacterized protein LOC124261065 [Haliotis rubra]